MLIEIDNNGREKAAYSLKGLGLKDISDISCDGRDFWVLSHESAKIVGFKKLGNNIKPDFSEKIENNPEQTEVVAVIGNYIYIISDRDGLLIKINKPNL